MRFSARLHDAVDTDTVLRRFLPVLAGDRGERRVAFAEYDRATNTFTHRWSTSAEGAAEVVVEDRKVELEPNHIHVLLADDAGGDRPLRPADAAPQWVLRDLFPGLEPEKHWLHARAISHEGRWLGVLVVATPRRWWQGRKNDDSIQAAGDLLELCLGRAYALRSGESTTFGGLLPLALNGNERLRSAEREVVETRAALEKAQRRLQAMEMATENGTEMLIDAHVELDRRSSRLRRQTRLLYLLRKLLERHAGGIEPAELAGEVVRTVSEAFEGRRCSILLLDHSGRVPELRVGAAVGFPDGIDHGAVRVPLGSGISGAVAHSRAPVVVRDPGEAESHPLVGDAWYTGTAFVSLPLFSRGRVLGVLNLTNFREGTIDNTELEHLRLVSLCVGLVVDHARLAERLFGEAPE